MKINLKGISRQEANEYILMVEDQNPGRSLEEISLSADGEFVNMTYKLKPVKFERIRRITGYLTGTLDKWNDAKQAEEKDRVKHV